MRSREWTDGEGQRIVLSEVDGQVRVSIYGEVSMKSSQGCYAMGADVPPEFGALLDAVATERDRP